MEDYAAVLDACKHCEWVGASINNPSGHVKYAEQSISDTNVRGVTPSMVPILDIDLTAGRMINDTDLRNNSAVVVVGPDITDNLMPGTDPIDKEIRIDSWVYRVVGVGKRKGKTLGQTLDNYALMPITSYQKQNGSHESIRISGKAAASGAGFDEAMDEARAVLRARRHVHPGDDDKFDIETNDSLLSIWSNFSGTFFYAMIGIAAISLVVGGIVIMNIMLVSVTERTREIGIRKAMGARRGDILLQFLIESVALAMLGGAIGVVFGIVIAKGVTLAIGMPSTIKLWAVMAGVLVAASVGIFFGVYPARRAAVLDPIAALRFET
jgi:putative ABC transport system permease protein